MLTAAAASVALETRKGRTATVRPSTILLVSSDTVDNLSSRLTQQHLALVPRIIATHWLRPDEGAVA